MSVRAVDSAGRTVLDHAADLTLSGFIGSGSASSIVLTECWDRSPDLVEFQNVSSAPVDTSGWVIGVNNAFNGIGSTADRVAPLPASMAPGQVVALSDDGDNNTFGGDIPWNHRNFFGTGRRGWAVILDATGQVVDLVIWGYNAGDIAGGSANINGNTVNFADHWNGAGVGWDSASGRSLQRSGDEDMDDANAWDWVGLTVGTENAALTVPFTGGAVPISIDPGSAQLINGVWEGAMVVESVETGVFLIADDSNTPVAVSSTFDTVVVTDSDDDGMPDAWEERQRPQRFIRR